MPSYDTMDDEEELHKILSNTDNFEERKKIRARMKEIREQKQKESEARRLQREKETEDLVRKKYEFAEQQKQKKLAQFQKDAVTASAERDKRHQASEDLLKDKIRQADEDKRRHLEMFDNIAKKEAAAKTTTTVKKDQLPGGGTRTTTITKTETVSQTGGLGGIQYGKPTAAKPQSAMSAFKQMDNAAPKPANFLAPGGRGGGRGGGGRGVTRSPSAIKQMLLDWCKSKTREYEQYGIEVKNFSNSWNDGMAFCALIHHFYPEAFDIAKLNPKARRANFTLAFDTAEKYADIAPLLDVDDMVKMKTPDWKCVFTYVQSFYRKLHQHDANKAAAQPSEQ